MVFRAKDGREAPNSAYWDKTYRDEGKWHELWPADKSRLDQAMALIGDVKGKRVLDLGGGPLLGRMMQETSLYTLVDMSGEALRVAKDIAPWSHTIEADAFQFLSSNTEGYDITVAMGLLDYCPDDSLDKLMELTPSNELVINASACEGYLLYKTRVTVYSKRDIIEACRKHAWRIDNSHPQAEHTFARFKRIVPWHAK